MNAGSLSIGPRIRRCDEAIGAALDRVLAPAANPWRHLGSLAFLAFVACALTGIYLYAVFDTSLAGAYDSGRALDATPAGRLMRGLHRYSADAFVLFATLHLAREAARGHFRGHRAWSWLTGLALVPLAWAAGLTGYWLAWDERSLFSATATADWLAAWPWSSSLFARNFVSGAAVSDRFFSLVVFVHVGVPLAALAATWAHLQRLSHVRAWPPAATAAPMLGALVVLSWVRPAVSGGPADALSTPAALVIDWFFHFPHVLAPAISPEGLSIAAIVGMAALAALPFTRGPARPASAVVDLARCNGCARCVADCPFAAVIMVPRDDGRDHPRQAKVEPDLCAACGICAGACPSSTPFGRDAPAASGIDLPSHTVAQLRATLDRALAAGRGAPVVFACRPGGAVRGAVAVECAAMVPPAFVQYALRRGAAGVVIAACREGDCEHRLGDRWMRERIHGTRAPALRPTVPRDRVRLVCCGSDLDAVDRAVRELARRLAD